MSDDLPKMWVEEIEPNCDPITGEIIETNTQALMPIEEEIPLPTISEQKDIVANSSINAENKGMLQALVEMNNVAETLALIRSNESAEQRKTVITAWCENFMNSRMRNNVVAETLKAKLLERLLNNIDNLDLQTTAQIYNDLSDVSNVDAQQAMANINGGAGAMPGQGSGINLTINNATSEGASITTNTLNAQPQQVGQLKEVVTLNSSIKAWSNIPLPKKKVIDADFTEK
jgi:hypothetical protein